MNTIFGLFLISRLYRMRADASPHASTQIQVRYHFFLRARPGNGEFYTKYRRELARVQFYAIDVR